MEQSKSPAVAIGLSFFITGAGQIYNGEIGKGIVLIMTYILCLIGSMASNQIIPTLVMIPLWIYGVSNARSSAYKLNGQLKRRLANEGIS